MRGLRKRARIGRWRAICWWSRPVRKSRSPWCSPAIRSGTNSLTTNGAQLLEGAKGDAKTVSPARYDKPVEGTDITYEDVSLNFLYWPKAKIDGSEIVDTLNCWKLHLEPGGQPSAYAAVELWVSMRTGNFLEGEGYDAGGKLVKRFKIVSGQRDPDGGWMLKQMRIETLVKGDSITKLFIDKELGSGSN
jgi:hypothetical protein